MDRSHVTGRLVMADSVVPGQITIEDGFIVAVEVFPGDVSAGADAATAGPLIASGFIDVHVHGWGGHDATGGDATGGPRRCRGWPGPCSAGA